MAFKMSESDKSNWTGKDFEFLIRGDVEIPESKYDEIMTPNSYSWDKVIRNGWYYYEVGPDSFYYSWEPPGIQMAFNEEVSQKAKQIAEEVISNILATGQYAELIELGRDQVHRFDL